MIRSGALVGSMTMISRLLGFLRDIVLARVFGAGPVFDAFILAFRLPNLLRRLFAEGSFSMAFVPVLNEYKERHGHAELKQLVDRVAGTLIAVLLVVTALGIWLAPQIVALVAPGFARQGGDPALAADLLRITFPYIFFISLTALAGGILNSWRQFAVPAVTPVLLNVSLIGAAWLFSDRFERPVEALAWGVMLAGVLQLGLQLPFLFRLGLLPRPRWGAAHAGVRRIMALMVPTLFGASVAQLNVLVDTFIASFLVAGSISWLYYADRMLEFPLGVFAIALATVILPGLSSLAAKDDRAGFSRDVDRALRLSVLIGLPAALGLFLLAEPIMLTLFQRGAFSVLDASMAAWALSAYALGLPAYIGVKILAPAFFARQDPRTPVRAALWALLVNFLLNLALVWLILRYFEFGAHIGLAAASSFAACVNAGLLYWHLRRDGWYWPASGWAPLLLRVSLALMVMLMVVQLVQGQFCDWPGYVLWQRIAVLLGLIASGGVGYFAALLALGWRPSQHALHRTPSYRE
jgi:putative peptidoglycan lipid II flippase